MCNTYIAAIERMASHYVSANPCLLVRPRILPFGAIPPYVRAYAEGPVRVNIG
jgi:hypothetical protein